MTNENHRAFRATLAAQRQHNSSKIADALIATTAEHLQLPQSEVEPTDEELIRYYVDKFGGTAERAIERLARFAAQYQQEPA